MGPEHEGSGKFGSEQWDDDCEEELQWGRSTRAPENSVSMRAARESYALQWGRSTRAPENFCSLGIHSC